MLSAGVSGWKVKAHHRVNHCYLSFSPKATVRLFYFTGLVKHAALQGLRENTQLARAVQLSLVRLTLAMLTAFQKPF